MSDSEEFTIIRGKNPVIKNADKVFKVTPKTHYPQQLSKKLDDDIPPVIPKITQSIAGAIIAGRQAKGWRQEDLARNACLHKQVIQGCEHVGTPINKLELQKICRALGINDFKITNEN